MNLDKVADEVIAEENIDNSVSAFSTDDVPEKQDEEPVDKPSETIVDDTSDTPADDEPKDDTVIEDKVEEPTKVESDERSPTETITEAKSLIQNLNLTEEKIFNQDGSVKPWAEVVPAGAYFASQLNPVTVTDKEGKTHEFMLISDVEKAFPNGFEAKNNIEQMKFERQIVSNENKFDEAVKIYRDAEARYKQETGDLVENRTSQSQVANEYKAMADQGLVPKVGDPNDPKFGESEAVKELNKILEWKDKTNAENAKKGLGQITSLYVAKQLMDTEVNKVQKEDKSKAIDKERKEVASLSSSPTPDTGEKQKHQYVPMSRLADSIIASEGLR